MGFITYYGRSTTEHGAEVQRLSALGWRMNSLTVYGVRANPLYAAVWHDRPGPIWTACHNETRAGYQARYDAAIAGGYRPVILAAAGPPDNPVFAGTFDYAPNTPIPATRFGLVRGSENDPSTIEHWTREARRNNWRPMCLAAYGWPQAMQYAGIWVGNDANLSWSMQGLDDDLVLHGQRVAALRLVGARPMHVSVGPDGTYPGIFQDDQIGEWESWVGLSDYGYQQKFDELVPRGYLPLTIQASGFGPNTRFAGLFAKDDSPRPLTWRQPTGPSEVAAIDDVMGAAMERRRIRGASLALVEDGRLVYARGYTRAEESEPTIEPTTLFRLGSVSKLVVCLAIHRLFQTGALSPTTRVDSLLAMAPADWSAASVIVRTITVQDLLENRTRLQPGFVDTDARVAEMFPRVIAPWPFPLPWLPVSQDDVIRFQLRQPLTQTPDGYNNFGYYLLGRVLMAAVGANSLPAALDRAIFQDLGITRIRNAVTLADSPPADEARIHPAQLQVGPSVLHNDRRLVPLSHGGPYVLDRDDGAGGLSGAAVDVARLLAMLDVRTNNPVLEADSITNLFASAAAVQRRSHGFDYVAPFRRGGSVYANKGGYLPDGNQTVVRYAEGDLSMVLLWNRAEIGDPDADGNKNQDGWWYPDFPELLNLARQQDWRRANLFPEFGMTSF